MKGMMLSQLIKDATDLLSIHGDLPVRVVFVETNEWVAATDDCAVKYFEFGSVDSDIAEEYAVITAREINFSASPKSKKSKRI